MVTRAHQGTGGTRCHAYDRTGDDALTKGEVRGAGDENQERQQLSKLFHGFLPDGKCIPSLPERGYTAAGLFGAYIHDSVPILVL
jgi:hypothetical protein